MHYHGIPNLPYTGKGVNVYIVDTGGEFHEDLQFSGGYNAVTGEEKDYSDEIGHGTHVACTAAGQHNDKGVFGVASDVKLWAVKVFDGQFADGDHYMNGLEWVLNHKVEGRKIVNLSLGSPSYWQREAEMIALLIRDGIVVTAAAGNNGHATGDVLYPARHTDVIASGSHDKFGNVSTFSNRGQGVTILAPGEDILSCVPWGGYESWNGTSMATPFVTGLVARMLERDPTLTPQDIKTILIQTATDAGQVGKDNAYGYGIINPKAALEFEVFEEEDERLDTVIEAAKCIRKYNKNERALNKKYLSDLRKVANDLQIEIKGTKKVLAARIWAAIQ